MMNMSSLPERALLLATSVGSNLKDAVPHAGKWLETGAKLGALKGGARVAGMFIRRNPAIAIATAAGAGLLWYAARRKAQHDAQAPIEGSSKRVEARRASATSTPRRKTTARKRASTSGNGAS